MFLSNLKSRIGFRRDLSFPVIQEEFGQDLNRSGNGTYTHPIMKLQLPTSFRIGTQTTCY